MTRLESILQGIEKLPITANKKNEYMLEILYEADEQKARSFLFNVFGFSSTGRSGSDLVCSLNFGETYKGSGFYHKLRKMLYMYA
jgi:hypothetical protein